MALTDRFKRLIEDGLHPYVRVVFTLPGGGGTLEVKDEVAVDGMQVDLGREVEWFGYLREDCTLTIFDEDKSVYGALRDGATADVYVGFPVAPAEETLVFRGVVSPLSREGDLEHRGGQTIVRLIPDAAWVGGQSVKGILRYIEKYADRIYVAPVGNIYADLSAAGITVQYPGSIAYDNADAKFLPIVHQATPDTWTAIGPPPAILEDEGGYMYLTFSEGRRVYRVHYVKSTAHSYFSAPYDGQTENSNVDFVVVQHTSGGIPYGVAYKAATWYDWDDGTVGTLTGNALVNLGIVKVRLYNAAGTWKIQKWDGTAWVDLMTSSINYQGWRVLFGGWSNGSSWLAMFIDPVSGQGDYVFYNAATATTTTGTTTGATWFPVDGPRFLAIGVDAPADKFIVACGTRWVVVNISTGTVPSAGFADAPILATDGKRVFAATTDKIIAYSPGGTIEYAYFKANPWRGYEDVQQVRFIFGAFDSPLGNVVGGFYTDRQIFTFAANDSIITPSVAFAYSPDAPPTVGDVLTALAQAYGGVWRIVDASTVQIIERTADPATAPDVTMDAVGLVEKVVRAPAFDAVELSGGFWKGKVGDGVNVLKVSNVCLEPNAARVGADLFLKNYSDRNIYEVEAPLRVDVQVGDIVEWTRGATTVKGLVQSVQYDFPLRVRMKVLELFSITAPDDPVRSGTITLTNPAVNFQEVPLGQTNNVKVVITAAWDSADKPVDEVVFYVNGEVHVSRGQTLLLRATKNETLEVFFYVRNRNGEQSAVQGPYSYTVLGGDYDVALYVQGNIAGSYIPSSQIIVVDQNDTPVEYDPRLDGVLYPVVQPGKGGVALRLFGISPESGAYIPLLVHLKDIAPGNTDFALNTTILTDDAAEDAVKSLWTATRVFDVAQAVFPVVRDETQYSTTSSTRTTLRTIERAVYFKRSTYMTGQKARVAVRIWHAATADTPGTVWVVLTDGTNSVEASFSTTASAAWQEAVLDVDSLSPGWWDVKVEAVGAYDLDLSKYVATYIDRLVVQLEALQ